jgi:hypothetical protein
VGQGIDVINSFFSEKTAEEILKTYGPADAIAANNVYAHVDNMHDFTRGIEKLLAPRGVLIFETHYLGNLIGQMQYDMVYHEHLSYYSLLALQKFFQQFGMEIIDVKPIPIHAGSMRYYVRKASCAGSVRQEVAKEVATLSREELLKRYDNLETFLTYATKVAEKRDQLIELLSGLKKAGRSIVGYGASGRANTIIQYCGLDGTWLDYIMDDAPAKQGFYTPGSHLLIRPSTALEEDHPDYVLVFAWSFAAEIKERCREYLKKGGRLIIPLPEVKLVSS